MVDILFVEARVLEGRLWRGSWSERGWAIVWAGCELCVS